MLFVDVLASRRKPSSGLQCYSVWPNTHAVWYWMHPVLDNSNSRHQNLTSPSHKKCPTARNGVCNVPLPCCT